MTFDDLLNRHIGSVYMKQKRLNDFLGQHNWMVDTQAGTIDFGGGRVYPIQVIGTESEADETWLWSWANAESGLPEAVVRCAKSLRELGERERMGELTQPELLLGDALGHRLAMVACGEDKADAFYRGPYAGGAAYFTIYQTPLQTMPHASPLEIVHLIPQILNLPVQHRPMVQAFLTDQKFSLAEEGDALTATREGQEILVRFDEMGRIADLQTTAEPEPAPAFKKAWWKFGR